MQDKIKTERHHKKALELYDVLSNCDDFYINKQILKALDALGDALRLYGPDQVLSSYNGGKDADVTMHLLRAAVAKYSRDKGIIFSPKLVYFEVEDDFEEVLKHLAHTEQLFDLEIKRYHCGIVEVLI
jgi:FAD synthetase